jgi:hypothetical protein
MSNTADGAPRGPSWAQVSTTRSFILLGVGAVIGLGLAGFSLFTAKGTATHSVPPEDVALVNQRPILRSDYYAQLETLTGATYADTSPEERKKVLNDMIGEEVLVQRGLEVDLAASDPDVRDALVAGVNLQVGADVVAQQPNDQQLMAFFNSHRDKYATDGVMNLRDLVEPVAKGEPLAAAVARAQAGAQALRQGVPVAQVMAQQGLKDSGKSVIDQDQFDYGVKAHLGDKLFAATLPLKDGEVSSPVVDADGEHVIIMHKRIAPVPLPYEKVSERVFGDYKRDALTRVQQANIRYLRRKADVLMAPDFAQ